MPGELRYAWRMFCKSPGLTAVIVVTLALGIGANTAVFSIVDGVLLKPLPYKDPARLVDVLDANVKDARLSQTFGTYSDFEEYSKYARSFEKIAFATWAMAGMTLTGNGPARNVLTIPVSQEFFSMLGVSAARGRTFEHSDLNQGCPVVLSDSFWRDALAGDPNIVGRTLNLDRRACTVIGVMPARFEFYPRQTQLWVLFTPDDPRPRDRLITIAFARLKPGVTRAQAQAELLPLHKAIHTNDWQSDFIPVVNGMQEEFTILAGRNLRTTSILLLGAVMLVLLIACVNVANVLLGRSVIRASEFAVRAALGSGRGGLIRQLLLESLLLAIAGGIGGILAAVGAVRYFRHLNPIELPVGASVSINLPVLAFTAAVTMLTALVFGLAPAWSGSRVDVAAGLRTAGRGAIYGSGRRFTRALIGCEIALALVLLSGASLLMRSVLKMSNAPLGFDPTHVSVMSTSLPSERYKNPADKLRFYDDLRRNVDAIPGVEGAAIATAMPPYGSGNYEIEVEGKGRTKVQDVSQNLIGPDYFRVLRIALGRGRVFDDRDRRGSTPAAIVNDAFVREYLADTDPIGKRVRAFGFDTGPWVTIVGVVATEKRPEFMNEMEWYEQAALYRPLAQDPPGYFSIALRTRAAGQDVGHDLDTAITAVDKDVAVGNIDTLDDRLGAFLKYPRFRAVVIDGFAALALILAMVGLHGLLSQYVAQRTGELGLRLAIGAQVRDILRLIVVQGGIPVIGGICAGVVLTLALSRYIASLLFGIAPLDLLTMVGAPLALVAVSFLAIVKPAINAAYLDPVAALREE